MAQCRKWTKQECMAALANPNAHQAAQLYQEKIGKIMGDCKKDAQTCIENKGQSVHDRVNGMNQKYEVFKNDFPKSVEVIKHGVLSGPACENAANYCSTCEQLWDFCPRT